MKKGDFSCSLAVSLNDFQELIAAFLLSKPFSHVLGIRATNYLFLREQEGGQTLETPQNVIDIGSEKL